jgi:AcrR family transcriptional regulator
MVVADGKYRPLGTRANLSKATIISKAAIVLERDGSLTFEPIAERCRVSQTTIRSRFRGGLEEIGTEIARTALDGVARPYKPSQSPEQYLTIVFSNLLKRLTGRRVTSYLVVAELFRNPVLSPRLAERILVCISELGANEDYLPRGLERVIIGLSDMIQLECAEADGRRRQAIANRIGLTITDLGVDEYEMLTENLQPLVDHFRNLPPPDRRTVARKHAIWMVESLKKDIEAVNSDNEDEFDR